jgi:hypothetical protein
VLPFQITTCSYEMAWPVEWGALQLAPLQISEGSLK